MRASIALTDLKSSTHPNCVHLNRDMNITLRKTYSLLPASSKLNKQTKPSITLNDLPLPPLSLSHPRPKQP
jgi:hypothetical protein